MIEVEVPQVGVVEFPDDTSSDVMRNAIEQRFYPDKYTARQERAKASSMQPVTAEETFPPAKPAAQPFTPPRTPELEAVERMQEPLDLRDIGLRTAEEFTKPPGPAIPKLKERPGQGKAEALAKAAVNNLTGLIDFARSPAGLTFTVGGVAAPLLTSILGTGWLATQIGPAAAEAGKASISGTDQEKFESYIGATLLPIFTAIGAKHGATGIRNYVLDLTGKDIFRAGPAQRAGEEFQKELAKPSFLPEERIAGLQARNIMAPGTLRPQEIRGAVAPAAEAPPGMVQMPHQAFTRPTPQIFRPRWIEPPEPAPAPVFPKVSLETRGKVSFGAEAPTLLRTAIRAPESVQDYTRRAVEQAAPLLPQAAAEVAKEAEIAAPSAPKEGAPNAIQIRSPAPLPVGETPRGSPEVGGQIRQPETPPEARPQAQTPAPGTGLLRVEPNVAETPTAASLLSEYSQAAANVSELESQILQAARRAEEYRNAPIGTHQTVFRKALKSSRVPRELRDKYESALIERDKAKKRAEAAEGDEFDRQQGALVTRIEAGEVIPEKELLKYFTPDSEWVAKARANATKRTPPPAETPAAKPDFSAQGEPVETVAKPMSNKAVSQAWKQLVETSRNDLDTLLGDWADARLSEDGQSIVQELGREREFKTKASKKAFLQWLASDEPFDPAKVVQSKEWVDTVNRVRQQAGIATKEPIAPKSEGKTKWELADWHELMPGDQMSFMESFERRFGDLDYRPSGPEALGAVMSEIYDLAKSRVKHPKYEQDLVNSLNRKDVDRISLRHAENPNEVLDASLERRSRARQMLTDASKLITSARLNYIMGMPREMVLAMKMSKKNMDIVQKYWRAIDAVEAAGKSPTPTKPATSLSPKYTGVPAERPAVTKESWQMTKDEWHNEHLADPITDKIHRDSVEQALREGKPVPAEVLADYPELKAREMPTPKPDFSSKGELVEGKGEKPAVDLGGGSAFDIIAHLESLKQSDPGTSMASLIPGFDPQTLRAIRNTGLDLVIQSIKAGRAFKQAADEGWNYVKQELDKLGARYSEIQIKSLFEKSLFSLRLKPDDASFDPMFNAVAKGGLTSLTDGITVPAPEITRSMLSGHPISDIAIEKYKRDALQAGVSRQLVDHAVDQLHQYNEMAGLGTISILGEKAQKGTGSVVIREGVLNTPGIEGVRRERIDTKLYPAIVKGERSAATGRLFEGGEERTAIPENIRGLKPRVFLNVPITQSHLQSPRPSGFNHPLMVTGNPHILNFKRPHPSWDSVIKVVRVKPVFGGNELATKAVASAINYAKEIGAKVLVTNFRSKQPWTLARMTRFVTTDRADPRFNDYWIPNPRPAPLDPRRMPDYTPFVPRNDKVAQAFRANGWGIEKDIYGKGGTWWWPQSKELDPAIKAITGDVPLEYCDLLHKGCPACRNCQKLTYPKAAGDPIVGLTDEPFCEHGCPQCFVRLGQSGIKGRKGISIGQNAKQAGYGQPDLSDIFPDTINVLQSAARRGTSGVANFVTRFMEKSPDDQMDMVMSLYMRGEISAKDMVKSQNEIMKSAESFRPVKEVFSEDITAKLESLKAKPDDKLYAMGIPGVAKAVWNTALDIAIQAIKAGRSISQAIDAAVTHLSKNTKELDVDAAIRALESQLKAKAPARTGPAPPAAPATVATLHPPGTAPPPQSRPLGVVDPSTLSLVEGNWLSDLGAGARRFWRSFAMKQAPRMTDASQKVGEAAVHYAASFYYGRLKGQIFARKVLEGLDIPADKFGTALAEDNLRFIKEDSQNKVNEALEKGDTEAATLWQDHANAVTTLIGKPGSPFKTEAEYQAFLDAPNTQEAIRRHTQLWQEQKDPLFREANDLDPDIELPSRGLQTGARINLKAVMPEEKGVAPIGRPPGFRQLATLKRRDPFARRATGLGKVYEGNYEAIMTNGFERELPIAKQHAWIKALIENGDAKVADREVMPDLTVKGEGTKGYLMRLNPWKGKFLQVRRSLADEFESVSGLDKPLKIFGLGKFNDFMTKMSIQGFAEATTHTANLLTKVFTGAGPTSNPLLNAVLKSVGRSDLLYTLPKVFLQALRKQDERMLELLEIGAAKEKYHGWGLTHILNRTDEAVRITSADLYDAMADKGWVEKSETGKREFVNEVGNYNKRLQPFLIRKLRESGIQPFATAMQTFNVMGLRRLAMAPGAKAPSNAAALALRADIAGGWIGALTLYYGLNMLVSGKPTGPAGTPLGAIGWTGDDGKIRYFHLLRWLGFERPLRITGIGPAIEARMAGLPVREQIDVAGRSVASTVLNTVMGPGPRAAYVAGTGLRPTMPWVEQAPPVPPTDSMNPLKTQLAKNIETALIEANPIAASAADLYHGEPFGKVMERQFARWSPKSGMRPETAEKLPEIIEAGRLNKYTDWLARESRKLDLPERNAFVRDQTDSLDPKMRARVYEVLRRKGVFRYR